MALVVLELPSKTTYHFTNTTGGTVPDYNVQASPEVAFTPDIKALSEDGVRRYIINPSTVSTDITGTYTANSKAFTIPKTDLAAINGGSYQKFAVDGGSSATVTLNYEIQKGDFLMRDGSLLPKGTTPTDEQKSNIAAIVFWTPAETATTGRTTPASLSDDKIMAADYPSCKHGLAVALKNIGYMAWQETSESVGYFQSVGETFAPTGHNKRDFKLIVSGVGSTDRINYILGYQNTQILKAYNQYCRTNGKNSNVVLPVDSLSVFEASFPAPKGSTGWFLPSVKELSLALSGDVDDINLAGVHGSNSVVINSALEHTYPFYDRLGEIGKYYLTSTESSSDYIYCIEMYVNRDYPLYDKKKQDKHYVRAVCAF